MRSFALAAVALAATALAEPATLTKKDATPACMTKSQASQVANNFADLIGKPFSTPLAQAAIADDFTDYSDSVIELINAGCTPGVIPLGSATFTSKDMFIAGQSSQPPIPFAIQKVWNNCDTVFLRWQGSKPGYVQPEQLVSGNIVLEVVNNPASTAQPWQIQTVYSEFNSGAWLVDIGNFTPTCPPAAPPSKRSNILV